MWIFVLGNDIALNFTKIFSQYFFGANYCFSTAILQINVFIHCQVHWHRTTTESLYMSKHTRRLELNKNWSFIFFSTTLENTLLETCYRISNWINNGFWWKDKIMKITIFLHYWHWFVGVFKVRQKYMRYLRWLYKSKHFVFLYWIFKTEYLANRGTQGKSKSIKFLSIKFFQMKSWLWQRFRLFLELN